MDSLAALGISLPSLIAQLVKFGLLLVLLRLVAYKPLMRMLDERSNRVRESMENAELVKQQLANAETEAAKQIEEASIKGQKIVDQAVQASEEVRRKAESEAKKQADAILNKAQSEIQREKELALSELRKEVGDLAVMVAGKAISQSLDDKAHQELINSVMKEASAIKG